MQLPHTFVQQVFQGIDILPFARRYEDAVFAHAGHPRVHELLQRDVLLGGRRQVVGRLFRPGICVHFVEHHQLRLVCAAQVVERLVHHLDLFGEIRMRHVHHVYQQVCLAHLVEGTLEGVHQVGGQFTDKSDGIGQQERQVADDDLAHRRIEGGKEFVFGKDFGLGKQIDEGRLAHIGVSHEGHADEPPAIFSLCRLLPVYVRQALFQQGHAVQDNPSVHFQLRLARSAQSHASLSATAARSAALAFQVRPQALQSRQHVPVLRQLHLGFGVGRLRAHRKDVQDQRSAVQDLHLQLALDIAQLLGRQFVVEDDHADFALGLLFGFDVTAYLLQFTLAHIGHRAGSVQPLREALHGHCARRLGQKLQFVQVFRRLAFVLLLGDEAHEHGRFGLGFGLYEFLHE